MSARALDHDVLIIGGGPAGVAAACALLDRGLRVAVSARPARRRGAETVGPEATAALTALGCPPARLGARPCAAIASAWGAPPVVRPAMMTAAGLGWHVERAALDAALLDLAAARGAYLLGPTVRLHRDGALIADQRHRARLVLDARGPVPGDRDAALIALTGELTADDPDDAMLRVEATADGWWYRVPHDAGTTIALITDRTWVASPRWRARWCAALAATALVGAGVADHAPHRLGGVVFAVGPIRRAGRAHPIGAAAWGFDPLCGDGIGLALADAQHAAAAAADHLAAHDRPWHALAAWRRTTGRAHLAARTRWYQAAAAHVDGAFWQPWRAPPAPHPESTRRAASTTRPDERDAAPAAENLTHRVPVRRLPTWAK